MHSGSPAVFARRAALALVLAVPLVAGCAGSRMTNMWKDPSYTEGQMQNVLVIAIRRDPVRRRMWEDGFVEALKAHGVTATPSYAAFPAAAPDTQQVIDEVRLKGYDGVIGSMRLPVETQTTYVPGYVRREPITVRNPVYGNYNTYWREVQVEGYTETNDTHRFQTDVWTTKNGGRLVWSGTVETQEAVGQSGVRSQIVKRIVPEIAASGIVAPEAKK